MIYVRAGSESGPAPGGWKNEIPNNTRLYLAAITHAHIIYSIRFRKNEPNNIGPHPFEAALFDLEFHRRMYTHTTTCQNHRLPYVNTTQRKPIHQHATHYGRLAPQMLLIKLKPSAQARPSRTCSRNYCARTLDADAGGRRMTLDRHVGCPPNGPLAPYDAYTHVLNVCSIKPCQPNTPKRLTSFPTST